MEEDYSEYDGYWPRREATIREVMDQCEGSFLLVCKGCYKMEPRVIAEFDPDEREARCEQCDGKDVLFLHETEEEADNGKTFFEYEIIRERLSDTLANAYCRHRNTCDFGENCRYVHSFYEMLIWKMESVKKSARASRKNLVRYTRYGQVNVYHCQYCCMNFSDNSEYGHHINSKFHQYMKRRIGRQSINWIFKPCQSQTPERCHKDNCECSSAHSEHELSEWKMRKSYADARNSFKEEPTIDYLSQLRERMLKEDNLTEFKNYLKDVVIGMETPKYEFTCKFGCDLQRLRVSFLQSMFSFKQEGIEGDYVQSSAITEPNQGEIILEIRFKNPGIFGQYSGTLAFDFGEEVKVCVTNFNITIRGEENLETIGICETLHQNWNANRFIIPYPVNKSGELKYEANVADLEKKYEIPSLEDLDTVYLENLTPSTYAKQMHNFLYKEELERRAVLSRLNIECRLKISEHIQMESGTFWGPRNDGGGLFATFTSPTRLSTDSDEGVLVRDSCSKVLIGKREGSTFAYECDILHWENNDVYLRLPPRCVKDMGLKIGQTDNLIVQYRLNRSNFCLRHYAIDSLQERIELICPLQQTYAVLRASNHSSIHLDYTQNSVLSQIHAERVRGHYSPRQKCFPPLVVAGPFGTGKTHTIRNVILEILERNGADARILLCTHSNSAADLYIKDIITDPRWKNWTDKILRVMYHKRNPGSVLVEKVRSFCLFTEDKKMFRYPTLQELRKYRIVITTFSTSPALGELGAGFRAGAFTHIFLDEASQAMEPEVIMPLSLASSETTRIIIAGDHRQINERMFLTDEVRIPTLLERMYDAYYDNYRQHRILLCNNYRCVNGLLQLISKLFYKEDILRSTGNIWGIDGYEPVRFVHVQGECKPTGSGDFINGSEANQVVSEIKQLLETGVEVEPEDILVAVPYHSQVQLVRDLLRKKRLKAVAVHAARNVQALQYKVVILSSVLRRLVCIKSGGKNWGFLSDTNLLNTVLTRAKSLVIAIGDAITLCSTGPCANKWETFLEHCEMSCSIRPEYLNIQFLKSEVQLARQVLNVEAKEYVPSKPARGRPPTPFDFSHHHDVIPSDDNGRLSQTTLSQDDALYMNGMSDKKEEEDQILEDLHLKSLGNDPNLLYTETDAQGNENVEMLDDPNADPNEIDIRPSERYAGKKPIYPKHSVGDLEMMLENKPAVYKRCKLRVKSWCTADATLLDSENERNGIHTVYLGTRNYMGRAFDQDEVVVQIVKKEMEGKAQGQVMGILKRHRNPRQGFFMCRPDEMNCCVMVPIEKSCTKFAIVTPKDHKQTRSGQIPVYKVKYTRASYVNLEMVSCAPADWNCAYAVKYLKWAEYHPYPLGYVAEVVSLNNSQKCLELEYGVTTSRNQSVMKQVRKIEVPHSNPNDEIEVFTIDPEGARDLDDALSLQECTEHDGCFLVGVHVADVASLLVKDSPVDREARQQGGTFYGANNINHMLPKELGIEKCSLLPGKQRPTISTFFHSNVMPPHIRGHDSHVKPQKCSIRSVCQMTYKEAEDIICNRRITGTAIDAKIQKLWKILWGWRYARLDAAAFFKDFETYKQLIEEGRAHLLIEEAMLAFNANIANYLVSKNFDIHLRVQELPHLDLWKIWLYSNYESIANSPYLSSNSDYLHEKREKLRLYTRDIEGLEPPSIPPKMSVLERKLHRRVGIFDLEDEFRKCLSNVSSDGVELYSTVWDDIMNCIHDDDMELVLFIIAQDFLHPSQVSALDQYHSIQNRSEWVSRGGENTLHTSLRLLRYTKCTSPIRRYPDIVIQRCIHRALKGLRPTDDTGKVHWDIDDRIRKYRYKLEVAELAVKLRKQPSVLIVSISLITDAGVKLCFSSMGDSIPSRARELEYAHLGVDLEGTDILENKTEKEIRRNYAGDIILDEIKAVWRFRFYDYGKFSNESATKLAPKNDNEETLTVRVPRKQWRNLIKTMSDPMKNYQSKEIKAALLSLTWEPQRRSADDQMCGETRNNPIPVKHHREIRNTLTPGSVIHVQLSSWLGKNRLAEPCVQLLKLTPDQDVCVHHNREPLHIFAHDAKSKENHMDSSKKYRKMWEPLIRLDSAWNAITDGASFVLKGVKITWNLFMEAMPNLNDADDTEPSNSFPLVDHVFKLDATFCGERYINFHINDLLCLRLPGVPNKSENLFSLRDKKNSTHTIVLHGSVASVEETKKKSSGSKISVTFNIFDSPGGSYDIFWNANNLWTMEIIPLSFLHRHMQSSLRKLTRMERKLAQQIALKNIASNSHEMTYEARVISRRQTLPGFPYPLNEVQKQERDKALRQKFTPIQGPPGTGKSFLGAQIAASFALINKKKEPENPRKVLYCGPSNKAVDVAARFLKDAENVKVVRMYSTSLEEKIFPNPLKPKPVIQSHGDELKAPDKRLDDISLHNLIRQGRGKVVEEIRKFDSRVRDPTTKFTRKEVDKYKACVATAKYQVLKNCDIIICTCSLATLLSELKDDKGETLKFSQCIIDECGMCSEPETMIPIVVSDPQQVVLIGDHMQLQPVIKCRKAAKLGLGESMFSQYRKIAGMLEIQYRMDPEIMEFPSETFYDGKLACDASISMRKDVEFFSSVDNNVFWHVKGSEKQLKFRSIRSGRKSKYNMDEVDRVIKLLVYLTNSAPTKLKPKDIMVLSPYTAQCSRIKKRIENERTQLEDVHVGTIVTSQGSEAEFVILSTVRSLNDVSIDNPSPVWEQKHLGFVCDPHQVNVALTRAKRGLCIIGNKDLLRVNKLWKDVIESYEKRGAVHNDLHLSSGSYSYEGTDESSYGDFGLYSIWHDIEHDYSDLEWTEDSDDQFSLEEDYV